jgi:hypothetical protein
MKSKATVPDKPQNVLVVLTPEEALYVIEVLLNAPMQVAVKDMPKLIGMVQSIVKKLQPPKPEDAERKPEAYPPKTEG